MDVHFVQSSCLPESRPLLFGPLLCSCLLCMPTASNWRGVISCLIMVLPPGPVTCASSSPLSLRSLTVKTGPKHSSGAHCKVPQSGLSTGSKSLLTGSRHATNMIFVHFRKIPYLGRWVDGWESGEMTDFRMSF